MLIYSMVWQREEKENNITVKKCKWWRCVVAAAVSAADASSKRSLSLSVLAGESRKTAIVRLIRSCTIQLLQIVSICCTRHADNMQLSAVSTFCNLLQSLTASGYVADSGKLLLVDSYCLMIYSFNGFFQCYSSMLLLCIASVPQYFPAVDFC